MLNTEITSIDIHHPLQLHNNKEQETIKIKSLHLLMNFVVCLVHYSSYFSQLIWLYSKVRL